MTLHRMDLPDAPVRVHVSRLTPGTWLWRCLDQPLHRGRGYATWDEAWAAMEQHRRSVHARVEPGLQMVMDVLYREGVGRITYTDRK